MPVDENTEGLFEVAPDEYVDVACGVSKVPVDKTFRVFDPSQDLLLPPSLDEWLPAGHMARFIAELVDEHLDLSRIHAGYTEGRGAPPYDPRLMVRILLYGYTTGVRSSRKLEAACVDVVAFRWLAAGTAPDYRSIARFRRPASLRAGAPVRPGVGVVSGRGDGHVGSGRPRWDQVARERFTAQGDELCADE